MQCVLPKVSGEQLQALFVLNVSGEPSLALCLGSHHSHYLLLKVPREQHYLYLKCLGSHHMHFLLLQVSWEPSRAFFVTKIVWEAITCKKFYQSCLGSHNMHYVLLKVPGEPSHALFVTNGVCLAITCTVCYQMCKGNHHIHYLLQKVSGESSPLNCFIPKVSNF